MIEHAHRERERERERESYTTSRSLQAVFAMQIPAKKNLSPSVLENASVSSGNYLPIFSTHGRDQGKIEG
jgi:hypothetical protein